MTTRTDALRHSPALWGLYTGAAAFTGMAVLIVGWNLWDHRVAITARLRNAARF